MAFDLSKISMNVLLGQIKAQEKKAAENKPYDKDYLEALKKELKRRG